MGKYVTYPLALVWGLYYYLIFQLIYLVRFGAFNASFSTIDIFLYVNGVLSVTLYVYFGQKSGGKWGLLCIPFVIALPVSLVGSLGGGLLGPVGTVIFGLVPFVIALPVGSWLINKFAGSNAAMSPESGASA